MPSHVACREGRCAANGILVPSHNQNHTVISYAPALSTHQQLPRLVRAGHVGDYTDWHADRSQAWHICFATAVYEVINKNTDNAPGA